MTVQIDTTAENNGVRLVQQTAHPSSPSSGHEILYVVSGSSHGGLFVKDSSGRQIGPFITGTPSGGSSVLVQKVGNQTGFSTGTTSTIPYDDTIPQSGEGYSFLSQTITPTNSSNILYIDVTIFGSVSGADYLCVSLIQEGVTDALAANAMFIDSNTASGVVRILYKMVAGTTSPITFKVNAGKATAGTFLLNGRTSTGRIFGGVACSSIFIEEVTP